MATAGVPVAAAGKSGSAPVGVGSSAGTPATQPLAAGSSGSSSVASGAAGTAAIAGNTSAGSENAGTGLSGGVAGSSGSGASAGAIASAAGAGAGGVAAGSGGAASPTHEDLGKGDGKDVIAIGDSWMLLSLTGIQLSLVRLSGQPYRTYGVPGTQLLNGQIPSQYTSAKRENPDIKTVVMTGGGNDLLLTGSTSGSAATTQIDKVADGLIELWNQMGKDGVKDIVYIEYSRGGTNEMNVNTGTAKIRPLCEGLTSTRCHWVDSDLYIMKQLMADGIHPTGDGCNKIAKAVIELMEKEGMRR